MQPLGNREQLEKFLLQPGIDLDMFSNQELANYRIDILIKGLTDIAGLLLGKPLY